MLNGLYNLLTGNNASQATESPLNNQQYDEQVTAEEQEDWVLVDDGAAQQQTTTRASNKKKPAQAPMALPSNNDLEPVMVPDVHIESVNSSDAEDDDDDVMDVDQHGPGDVTPPASLRVAPAARVGGVRQVAPVASTSAAASRRHTRALVQKIMESDVSTPPSPPKRSAKEANTATALRRANATASAPSGKKRANKQHARVNANRNNDRKNQYY